jgi:hypothetical protein
MTDRLRASGSQLLSPARPQGTTASKKSTSNHHDTTRYSSRSAAPVSVTRRRCPRRRVRASLPDGSRPRRQRDRHRGRPGCEQSRSRHHVAISFAFCGGCPCCLQGHPAYGHQFAPLNYGGVRSDGSSPLSSGQESIAGNFFGQSTLASHAITRENNVVKVDRALPLEH